MKKRTAGISKTTTVSVRLEPKMHYALTLLARKRHRTLTSVIEWALDRAINDPVEGLFDTSVGESKKPASVMDKVWDPVEADRLIKLSLYFPRLLSYEEELLIKAVRENPRLWRAKDVPNYDAIRDEWDDLRTEYLSPGG